MPCFFHSGNVYLNIQREEARVCKGYRLCTLSEHGAPGQESSTVTLEKSGGRARTDSLPQAVLGPRPCSPLTHRVLPLPQYPLCPPQPLMQGITNRFEFHRTKVPPVFSSRTEAGKPGSAIQQWKRSLTTGSSHFQASSVLDSAPGLYTTVKLMNSAFWNANPA